MEEFTLICVLWSSGVRKHAALFQVDIKLVEAWLTEPSPPAACFPLNQKLTTAQPARLSKARVVRATSVLEDAFVSIRCASTHKKAYLEASNSARLLHHVSIFPVFPLKLTKVFGHVKLLPAPNGY